MKKWIAGLLCPVLVFCLWGCGKQAQAPTTDDTVEATEEVLSDAIYRVGVCLPNLSDEYWIRCGAELREAFKRENCQVFLEDGQNDTAQQAEQVKNLLAKPVDALVVAAVDSIALSSSISHTQVPVFALDRLMMNTDKVVGLVAFDYVTIGMDIANKLVEEKALTTARAEDRSYTIEFFMGDSCNNNSLLFYQGIMQVLKSYLDSGVLVCSSGRTDFEDACITGASRETAKKRCEGYAKSWPNILICGEDVLADGCVDALKEKACPSENWPLIIGHGATEAAIDRIVEGEQFLTVYLPAEDLAEGCADTVLRVLEGEDMEQNFVHNGAKNVPADLYLPEMVHKDNVDTIPMDFGIYEFDNLEQ